jgi:predicted phage terminase large subunit-like protein
MFKLIASTEDASQAATDLACKIECEQEHLFFVRYFFKLREGFKFRVNWHHHLLCDTIDQIIAGKIKHCIINVPPGSSKTEIVAINFMSRGLAVNARSRFLHISYADDLVTLNSSTVRGIVQSEDYQRLWYLPARDDADAKKRWNVDQNGRIAGGVYAVSLGGTITGFRAGHMQEGFQGAIIIDDPMKPADALSDAKRKAANNILINTIKSRTANPDTPIVVIMQRLAEEDSTGFLLKGGTGISDWHHVMIPALIDDVYVRALPEKYRKLIENDPVIGQERDDKGRYSYWPYKEPLQDLLQMERAAEYVFSGQYMQKPTPLGGGLCRGAWFGRYVKLPRLKFRAIYADTAQKTGERNDFSVFQCWGLGEDGKLYLIDQIRGKWEAWMLEAVAVAFWNLHKAKRYDDGNSLRKMMVEDKSSGTGLIQNIRKKGLIPIEGIEREKDKFMRFMDVQSYYKNGFANLPPEDQMPMLTVCEVKDDEGRKKMVPVLLNPQPWVKDYVIEHEQFTPDDTHQFDDQLDPTIDALTDMLGKGANLEMWGKLGKR